MRLTARTSTAATSPSTQLVPEKSAAEVVFAAVTEGTDLPADATKSKF